MNGLTDHTTLVLVSHSMQQIVSFCERAVWIKHGRIERDGNASVVCAAYEEYMAARAAEIYESVNHEQRSMPERSVESRHREPEWSQTVTSVFQASRDLLKPKAIGAKRPILRSAAYEPGGKLVHSTETGAPVRVQVQVECPRNFRDFCEISLYAFTDGGDLIWISRSNAISLKGGHQVVRLSTDKMIAGVGDYVLSVAISTGGARGRSGRRPPWGFAASVGYHELF